MNTFCALRRCPVGGVLISLMAVASASSRAADLVREMPLAPAPLGPLVGVAPTERGFELRSGTATLRYSAEGELLQRLPGTGFDMLTLAAPATAEQEAVWWQGTETRTPSIPPDSASAGTSNRCQRVPGPDGKSVRVIDRPMLRPLRSPTYPLNDRLPAHADLPIYASGHPSLVAVQDREGGIYVPTSAAPTGPLDLVRYRPDCSSAVVTRLSENALDIAPSQTSAEVWVLSGAPSNRLQRRGEAGPSVDVQVSPNLTRAAGLTLRADGAIAVGFSPPAGPIEIIEFSASGTRIRTQTVEGSGEFQWLGEIEGQRLLVTGRRTPGLGGNPVTDSWVMRLSESGAVLSEHFVEGRFWGVLPALAGAKPGLLFGAYEGPPEVRSSSLRVSLWQLAEGAAGGAVRVFTPAGLPLLSLPAGRLLMADVTLLGASNLRVAGAQSAGDVALDVPGLGRLGRPFVFEQISESGQMLVSVLQIEALERRIGLGQHAAWKQLFSFSADGRLQGSEVQHVSPFAPGFPDLPDNVSMQPQPRLQFDPVASMVRSFAADGDEEWSISFASLGLSGSAVLPDGRLEKTRLEVALRRGDGWLLVAQRATDGFGQGFLEPFFPARRRESRGQLLALDAAGRLLWSRGLPLRFGEANEYDGGFELVDAGPSIGVREVGFERSVIRWYDAVSGTPLNSTTETEGTSVGPVPERHPSVRPGAGQHWSSHVRLDASGPVLRLTRSAVASQPSNPPLQPTALAGIWYDPSTAGQGLLLDASTEDGYVFGAWFAAGAGANASRVFWNAGYPLFDKRLDNSAPADRKSLPGLDLAQRSSLVGALDSGDTTTDNLGPADRLQYLPGLDHAQRSSLRWYSFLGDLASGQGTLYRSNLAAFAVDGNATTTAMGVVKLELIGCDRLRFTYTLDGQPGVGSNPIEGPRPSAARELVRLGARRAPCVAAEGAGSEPEQPAQHPVQTGAGFHAASSGSWLNPAQGGQGLLFEVLPPGRVDGQDYAGQLAGAWFTFDPAGRSDDADSQHWFSLLGSLQPDDRGTAQLTILRTLGGVFDAAPTQNTYRVGTAELVFASCDRAVLRYRFDANAGWAGDYAGRTGEIPLQRFEDCARP
jgi:hypothetical protein